MKQECVPVRDAWKRWNNMRAAWYSSTCMKDASTCFVLWTPSDSQDVIVFVACTIEVIFPLDPTNITLLRRLLIRVAFLIVGLGGVIWKCRHSLAGCPLPPQLWHSNARFFFWIFTLSFPLSGSRFSCLPDDGAFQSCFPGSLSPNFSNVPGRLTLLSHQLPDIWHDSSVRSTCWILRWDVLPSVLSSSSSLLRPWQNLGRTRCVLPRVLPHGVPNPWWIAIVALDGAMMLEMEAAPSTTDFGRYHLFNSCHALRPDPWNACSTRRTSVPTSPVVVVIKHDANALLWLTLPNTLLRNQVEWMLRFDTVDDSFAKDADVTELERMRSICAGVLQQCRQKDKLVNITEPPRTNIGMVFVQNRVMIELPQSAAFERQARGVTWNHEMDRTARQWQWQWHSEKSIQQLSMACPYEREWKVHDTTKKRLPKLMGLALLTKCALAHCWWHCVC